MSRLNHVVLAAVTAVMLAAGCYQDEATDPTQGNRRATRVLITDAPFPFDTVQSVDIYFISISASTEPDTGSNADNMQWLPIVEPHRQINLLSLQRGDTALLGQKEIPADQYKAIRVIIDVDSSAIRFKDGSQAVVRWGGSGRQALHTFVQAAMDVPIEGADIVLDFDVGRTFTYNELGDGAFDFVPWIRALNVAATGSISGTVSSDTSGGTAGPLANAIVSAWGGGPGNWYVYSTGTTDAAGHYKLAYLFPGRYIVGVDPPASRSNLDASLDSNVVVDQGADTPHDVVLSVFRGSIYIFGASSMLVNRTNRLEAIVVSAQHEQDTTAAVVWQNLDTAVLGLRDSLRFAYVTSKQVGSGRIVASSGALVDTLRIVVAPDSTQPAPVRP